MFTARQLKIIELIAGSVGGIYNTKIAEALHVSSRTIRGEIQAINAIWHPDCKIGSSKQYGYYFTDEDLRYVRDFLYHSKEEHDPQRGLSQEANRQNILLGLLIHASNTSIYELGEELFLSPQSIAREIAKLRKELAQTYSLEPIGVKGERICFELEEAGLRRLLFRIMKNEITRLDGAGKPFSLKELLPADYEQAVFTGLTHRIDAFFRTRDIVLNDDCLILISGALYITHIRNSHGFLIAESRRYTPSELLEAFLRELIRAGIQVQEADKAVLYDFLHTFRLSPNGEYKDDVNDFSIRLFDEFCNEVLEKYNFDLRSSQTLYQNMLVHVEFMLRRLRGDFELTNPILSDVKKNYPFAYEISMLLVHIVYKYIGKYIQDDELSYIAIYIEHFIENVNEKLPVVFISNARRGVVRIVSDWLRYWYVNQLDIVELSSQSQLDEYCDQHPVELILSLPERIVHPTIPVYHLSSFPDENDRRQISSMIHKIKMNHRFRDVLERYFSERLVVLHKAPCSFEQAIEEASRGLFAQGCIEDAQGFYEDILLREVNYPTIVNERMMLPHPLATFAKKTAVHVSLLKHPLAKEQKGVEVIFTLAIERKQNDDINVLFAFFKQIASSKAALDRLCAVGNARELIEELFRLSAAI